jgi:hypothetical protein
MQPNVVTYCSIISGLARSRQEGFVKSAHKLWRELQRSGQHLDAAAFRTGDFVKLMCPLWQHNVVQNNDAKMHPSGVPDNLGTSVVLRELAGINACVENGNLRAAQRVAAAMRVCNLPLPSLSRCMHDIALCVNLWDRHTAQVCQRGPSFMWVHC